jgi:plastocyanin
MAESPSRARWFAIGAVVVAAIVLLLVVWPREHGEASLGVIDLTGDSGPYRTKAISTVGNEGGAGTVDAGGGVGPQELTPDEIKEALKTGLGSLGVALPRGKAALEVTVLLDGEPKVETPKMTSDPVCMKNATTADPSVRAKDGKLAGAMVRVWRAKVESTAPEAPVVIEQRGCLYEPRVAIARAGQKVQIRNEDGTLHNVHAYAGQKTVFNQAQPPKAAPIERDLGTSAVVRLKCDVHPWMTGWVHVVDTPFAAISADDGKIRLEGLPKGTFIVSAWHERFGMKFQKIFVGSEGVVESTLRFDAKNEQDPGSSAKVIQMLEGRSL